MTADAVASAEPSSDPEVPALRARLADGVRIRRETRFGAIAYSSFRDHFFALDKLHADVLDGIRKNKKWQEIQPVDRPVAVKLAELGLCEIDPSVPQRAFYGRSQVGVFSEFPTCARPLVVNCFATSHCSLRCLYCHADDLMTPRDRDAETDEWVQQVVATAGVVPAMVGVVTGGEPLLNPDRARRIIEALAPKKAIVLDTSGVGDIVPLIPLLRRHHVHVRVSIDSADPAVNNAQRLFNRQMLPAGTDVHATAVATVRRVLDEKIPCSVQTVVTNRNGDLESLLQLRNMLTRMGVNTWVLHVLVPVGKAAGPAGQRLANAPDVAATLAELVRVSARDHAPIDIRVTRSEEAPNSTLLINAEGQLVVESPDRSGKVHIDLSGARSPGEVTRRLAPRLDTTGHASRYLNGVLDVLADAVGAPLSQHGFEAGRDPVGGGLGQVVDRSGVAVHLPQ